MRRYEKWPGADIAEERWGEFPSYGAHRCRAQIGSVASEVGERAYVWLCWRARGHEGEHCAFTHGQTLTIWDDEEAEIYAFLCALQGDGK